LRIFRHRSPDAFKNTTTFLVIMRAVYVYVYSTINVQIEYIYIYKIPTDLVLPAQQVLKTFAKRDMTDSRIA